EASCSNWTTPLQKSSLVTNHVVHPLAAMCFSVVALPGWSLGQAEPKSTPSPDSSIIAQPDGTSALAENEQPPQRTRGIPLEKAGAKILLGQGNQFAVEVTGSTDGVVSGTDIYFWDSSLPAATVHAGLLKPGEKGIVEVTVVKCPQSGQGSTRHGVRSCPGVGH